MIVIRDMVDADKAFIFSTWLRGLYFGHSAYRDIDKDVFFTKYHGVVSALLASSRVSVACLADDSDVLVGFVCYSGPTLHWVFTKRAWRKLGIAKSLVPAGITTVSHMTKVGKSLKPKDWKYDPFL